MHVLLVAWNSAWNEFGSQGMQDKLSCMAWKHNYKLGIALVVRVPASMFQSLPSDLGCELCLVLFASFDEYFWCSRLGVVYVSFLICGFICFYRTKCFYLDRQFYFTGACRAKLFVILVFIVFGWCGRTFVFGFVSRFWVRHCFGSIKHSYLGCVKFMMICACVQF